ncbi:hypothetical protein BT67DRAFT_309993 [Trichocladium antarcticum]|uniref:Uncharacterized protein n=1 Tax=Trichocladium antarcticum TaxID=1450529 RepID=A0AAN6ZDT1_9PEZI|nr:hypothetical protein BT67DRAFT_309993 [Trichocladium antarcticum]
MCMPYGSNFPIHHVCTCQRYDHMDRKSSHFYWGAMYIGVGNLNMSVLIFSIVYSFGNKRKVRIRLS